MTAQEPARKGEQMKVVRPRTPTADTGKIAACLHCTLPDCDDADPRCPQRAGYKRKSKGAKVHPRIAETVVKRAAAECREAWV
jgi:hypothetical protein